MSYRDDLEFRNHVTSVNTLVRRPELDSGIRLDGRFEGPKTDTSCIWKGRPPTLEDGTPFPSLIISAGTQNPNAEPDPALLGQTITLRAEGAAGGGGRVIREFEIGFGLTAELALGYYEHTLVRTVPRTGEIPAGMTLFFVWSLEVFSATRLVKFVDAPVPGALVRIPEGADEMIVESAGTLTFPWTPFGAAFTRVVVAGERIPILGPSVASSVANQYVFRLKPM